MSWRAVFSKMMELSIDGVFLEGLDGTILDCNSAGLKMFGRTRAEVLSMGFEDLLLAHSFPKPGLVQSHREPGEEACEGYGVKKNGEIFPLSLHSQILSLQGEKSWVIFVHDMSREVAIRQELAYAAQYDALTKLKNRRAILEDLEKLRHPQPVGMLDLDHFKGINDTYGHLVGDQFLRCLGGLLNQVPYLTAGRFGGEEFLLLFGHLGLSDARQALGDLLEKAGECLPEYGGIHFSAGLVWYDPALQRAEQALSRADAMLYQAKAMGRNRVAVESPCAGARED